MPAPGASPVPPRCCRCCRELLEHSNLIERLPASRTRSRHWRIPPHQAVLAAGAVAALLGTEPLPPLAAALAALLGTEQARPQAAAAAGLRAAPNGELVVKEEGDSGGWPAGQLEEGGAGGGAPRAQQAQQAPAGAAGAAAGGAAWPIPLSPALEAELRRRYLLSPQYSGRVQRCAACILHALLLVRSKAAVWGGAPIERQPSRLAAWSAHHAGGEGPRPASTQRQARSSPFDPRPLYCPCFAGGAWQGAANPGAGGSGSAVGGRWGCANNEPVQVRVGGGGAVSVRAAGAGSCALGM